MIAAQAERRARGRSRFNRRQRRFGALVVGAGGGIASLAHPTGLGGFDALWTGALAGLAAFVASYARRGPLLIAACFAAMAAPDRLALVPAAVAIVAAASSTADLARPSPFLRGVAGGASVSALLVASHEPRHPLLASASWVAVLAPIFVSGLKRAPLATQRRVAAALVGIAAAAVLVCLAAGLGVAIARHEVDRGVDALDAGLAAARAGELETAREELESASVALDGAAQSIGRWGFFARAVPGASQNVRAVQHVLQDASLAATRAEAAAGITDSEELSVDGGQVNLLAVQSLAQPLNQLVTALEIAADRIDGLADEPLLPPIRRRLDELSPDLERALREADTSASAARVVPAMLGRTEPQRYLILFTSPTEARGRFGFPAAYGTLLVEQGGFDLEVAQSISALQSGEVAADQGRMPLDDDLVGPYIAYGATRNWRSITVPPDFPTVAALAQEMWRQTGTGEIDGVLRVDTTSLAAFVEFTGPVPVTGRADPLDASEVTGYLNLEQYLLFGDQAAGQRQEALEELAETVFDRLLEVDLPGPRGLADVLAPMVEQGHLQLVSFDDQAMGFLDDIGITGRFAPPRSADAFVVGAINLSGNKIDAFLGRTIDYDVTVADDGTIAATATITLGNLAPASGLPDYVIGSARALDPPAVGTNRTVAIVWSALPLVSVSVDGAPAAASSNPTGGWWVHGISLEVPAQSIRTITLELAGPPARPGAYGLSLLPGNAVVDEHMTVTVRRDGQEPSTTEITLRQPIVVRP